MFYIEKRRLLVPAKGTHQVAFVYCNLTSTLIFQEWFNFKFLMKNDRFHKSFIRKNCLSHSKLCILGNTPYS